MLDGTNYVVLDFTPDVIEDEFLPKPFLDTFTTVGRRGEYFPLNYSFLDYDGKDGINEADAELAAEAIVRDVYRRLRPFIKDEDLDIRLYSTRKHLDTNSNAGLEFLQTRIDRERENAFVIYVGGDLKTINPDFITVNGENTDLSGVGQQAFDDGNHEWYAYAFAEKSAEVLAKEHFKKQRTDITKTKVILDANNSSNSLKVTARMLDDPSPDQGDLNVKPRIQITSGNASFINAGVVPGDLVEVVVPDSDGNGTSTQSFQVGEILNNGTLKLNLDRDVAGGGTAQGGGSTTWDPWLANGLEITIHRVPPATSQEYTQSVSWAIVHELGHLLGLGHICRTDDGDCETVGAKYKKNPKGDLNLMNYSSPKSENRFVNGPAKYETEQYDDGVVFDSFYWEADLNHFQEVRNSFLFNDAADEFLQPSTSDILGNTYLEEFETAVAFGLLEPAENNVDFLTPPPERAVPPAASQGTVGATTPANIAGAITTGFNNLRQNLFDDISGEMNLGSGTLPVMASNLGDLLGVNALLTSNVDSLDVSSATTMSGLRDQLVAAGFTVDRFITDSNFGNLAANSPADFIQVSRSYALRELFGETMFDDAGAAGIGDLSGIDLEGELGVDGQALFSVTFGVDTQGFYLLPGEILRMRADAFGALDVGLSTAAQASGNASAFVVTELGISAAHADGRVRLSELTSSFAQRTQTDVVGGASLGMNASFNLPGGASIPLYGNWSWDVSGGGSSLLPDYSGFDDEFVVDELIELVGTGLNQLGAQAAVMTKSVGAIPFLGKDLASRLTPLVEDSISYDNEFGSGRAYLEELGFEILSVISPADLIAGNFTSGDLLRLRYDTTAMHDLAPFGFDGDLKYSAAGVPVDLSLHGTVNIDPSLSFDLEFGLDATKGPFVIEGASISADLPVTVDLTGELDIGNLAGVVVNTSAVYETGMSFVISDFDSVANEKFYLSQLSLGKLLRDTADVAQTTGDVTLDLAASLDADAVPIIGKHLTQALTWEADATYDVATKAGTFEIKPESVPSLANIERQLRDDFLTEVDAYNPLPVEFRRFLSMDIALLGNKSLLDMLGLGARRS